VMMPIPSTFSKRTSSPSAISVLQKVHNEAVRQ
jgi:hypothetical protein